MIKVIILTGRKDSIEKVGVRVFNRMRDAIEYCNFTNTNPEEKYWVTAAIIDDKLMDIRNLFPDRYKDMI
jgi:hypothetical protein